MSTFPNPSAARSAVPPQESGPTNPPNVHELRNPGLNANAAWLVLAVIAFNLTRAAGTIAGGSHARATTATIRRRIINIPGRIATSARRITLHLPIAWPWQEPWQEIFDATLGPPAVATT